MILFTGHGSVRRRGAGACKQGAFDYLMKPIDIDELVEKIRARPARKVGSDQ